ncbi:MAG TPA: ThiF family adenylyltransferase [Solirubrobacterales bacterium]|nr:ThiF family adenylyltransferase [Solirubrobacterales bacterium]
MGLLLKILDDPYADTDRGRNSRTLPQSTAFVSRLLASAIRNPEGSPQYFLLAVPHPAGGPHHLLGGRLTADASDSLRAIAAEGGIANIKPGAIDEDVRIEWCAISDERPDVTTRRDERRPVNGFLEKSVQVWGCGGLGSWIAEFIARAGASTITVCDPGTVSGGLLVRQNYREDDIGMTKAEALGRRLQAIRDDLNVDVETNPVPTIDNLLLSADIIIDATISNSIAKILDGIATTPARRGLIAQVATDARSGTLGVANICGTGVGLTPSTIDMKAGEKVLARGDLEDYHPLWENDPDNEESLIPTRGCSVPTFHGSAADLAGVSAALVNVIGNHLIGPEGAASSGTHLIALPYSGSSPAHIFLPAEGDAVRGT